MMMEEPIMYLPSLLRDYDRLVRFSMYLLYSFPPVALLNPFIHVFFSEETCSIVKVYLLEYLFFFGTGPFFTNYITT